MSARGGNSTAAKYLERRLQMNEFGKNPSVQRFHPVSESQTLRNDSAVKIEERVDCTEENASRLKKTEEIGTQTSDLVPYEHLLKDILNQRNQEANNSESRLSPTTILDRYVETCARTSSFSDNRSS